MPVSLLKKETTLAQVFSCEICKILKNTFFHRALPVAASVLCFKSTYQAELFLTHFQVSDALIRSVMH